jgi:hypothetical protein
VANNLTRLKKYQLHQKYVCDDFPGENIIKALEKRYFLLRIATALCGGDSNVIGYARNP